MALARHARAGVLAVLAALAPPAWAQEAGKEKPLEPPKLRLDPRALRLLDTADGRTWLPVDGGLKSLRAVLVAEDPLYGKPSARVEFDAPGTLALHAREEVPEAMRGFVEEKLRPVALLFVGRRWGGKPADAHLDYREEDGRACAVFETAAGPDAGVTRTIRFTPDTGLVASEEVSRDRRSILSAFRYEKAGERWRLLSILGQVPGPDGPPVRVEVTLERRDAEGIPIPWRITQKRHEGAAVRCVLESVVVNGKRVLNPDEAAAEKDAGKTTPK